MSAAAWSGSRLLLRVVTSERWRTNTSIHNLNFSHMAAFFNPLILSKQPVLTVRGHTDLIFFYSEVAFFMKDINSKVTPPL